MKAFFLLSLLAVCLSAEQTQSPWLTGPLIAPPGTAVPYGEFLLKSYFTFNADTGIYGKSPPKENFYSVSYQGFYFFGITPWCDINVVPRVFYQTSSNQHYANCGDLTAGIDIQLMSDTETPYFPGIKLAVREIFPTGSFDFLHPRKLLTDRTGNGTFATQFDLVLYKLFALHAAHWLSLTISAEYTVNTPVNVHGFNAYGGGFGTRGKVLPGNRFQGIVSFELTLSQNWAFAWDNVYTYTDSSAFYGLEGITFEGTLAHVGPRSSNCLSFAPALEYNFSPALGLIAGAYFSAWGKRTPEFRGAQINLNYHFGRCR